MSGHTCPIRDCTAHVPSHHVMCPRHWSMVTPKTRHAMYRARSEQPGAVHLGLIRQAVAEVAAYTGARE